jgi:tetratricopeptide (TPR) repeat protein
MNRTSRTSRGNLRLIPVVLVLINSLFWSASIHASGNKYADYLRAGMEQMAQGNLSSAKANFEAAIELEPENSSGWFELGTLYGQIHDFRNAEEAFRHSLRLQPDQAKAHYMLGLSLIGNPQSKSDWPSAIAEFRAALKIRPDYPEALDYLGVGLTATGQTDLAISELEKAIRLKPLMLSSHFNLAIALESSGRLDEAVQEYRKAVSAKGVYPEASSALGKLLFRMGQTVEAEQQLRTALHLNPDLQDAHYALGRVLNSARKASEAKIEFNEAIELGKRESNAIESSQLSNSAIKLAAEGEMVAAETSLKKAILLRPDYGVPHYNLGLILADQGNLNGAVHQLTQAISLMPGQASPWFDLGRVQRLQREFDSAFQSLSWAASLTPSDPRIKAELQLLRAESDKELSTTSSDLQPTEPRTGSSTETAQEHFAFARDLMASGDSLGAVGELLRSLEMLPGSVEIRWALAVCYERLGNSDRALLEYQKIHFVDPGNIDAYLALGRILMAQGLELEAKAEFRQALVHSPDSVAAQRALDDAVRITKQQ